MTRANPYHGAHFRLATHHRKGEIIAPIFREVLGADVEEVDCATDELGTFDGEVPRRGTPFDTAMAKAGLITVSGARGRLASEGSFSPHPHSPFVTVNTELVVLRDDVSERVLVGSAVSATPHVFRRDVGEDPEEIARIVDLADLGPHALVVQAVNDNMTVVAKGLQSSLELSRAVERAVALSPSRLARVTSDGRAHLNATRREVIAAAARDLAERLDTLCPSCDEPGWGRGDALAGAPCRECGSATAQVWGVRWACPACDFSRDEIDHEQRADPARCSWCNP